MTILFSFLAFVGFLLQAALIHVLLVSGRWRKYFPLFSYSIVLFLTGILDKGLRLDLGAWSRYRVLVYWIDDSLRWFFLFVVIFSLFYQVMTPRKVGVVRFIGLLCSVSLAVVALALVQKSGPSLSNWFTPFLRNVSVIAMVLNVFLWMLLITNRNAPRQLLLLSCGVGIQMAGEAVGHSVRLFTVYLGKSPILTSVGNVVLILAHLLCLAIWISVARAPEPVSTPQHVPEHVPDSPGEPQSDTIVTVRH
jgi:hypothetical protein